MVSTISKQLMAQIVKKLKKQKDPELYWDYRDEFQEDTIVKALEKNYEYPLDYIYDMVNEDAVYDTEIDHIVDTLEWFKSELQEEMEDEDLNLKELARDLREELTDYFSVNYNIKQPLNFQIPVRLSLYSNYDCINSHWFACQGGEYAPTESYFYDCMKVLKLNPEKVKELFLKHEYDISRFWKGSCRRSDQKRLVEYDPFWVEMENRSCPASLLTITGTVNAYKLLKTNLKTATVIVPKGNSVGFFSSMQGGGSVMEAPLLYDYRIDLSNKKDPYWGLSIDSEDGSYGMKSVYGVSSDFFGSEIELISKRKYNKKQIIEA